MAGAPQAYETKKMDEKTALEFLEGIFDINKFDYLGQTSYKVTVSRISLMMCRDYEEVVEAISHCKNIVSIDLSGYAAEKLPGVFPMMQSLPRLQNFTLTECCFRLDEESQPLKIDCCEPIRNDRGFGPEEEVVAEFISKAELRTVRLINVKKTGGKELAKLFEAVRESKLTSLSMGYCEDGVLTGRVDRIFPDLAALKKLELVGCHLDDRDANFIATALLECEKLTTLDIRDSTFTHEEIDFIANAVAYLEVFYKLKDPRCINVYSNAESQKTFGERFELIKNRYQDYRRQLLLAIVALLSYRGCKGSDDKHIRKSLVKIIPEILIYLGEEPRQSKKNQECEHGTAPDVYTFTHETWPLLNFFGLPGQRRTSLEETPTPAPDVAGSASVSSVVDLNRSRKR